MGKIFNRFFNKEVKLRFSTCGIIMIDSLPFSFGVESIGKASDKGLCVSLSGEAVENGEVSFTDFEYHENNGAKITVIKRSMEYFKKKDGKRIYRAGFTDIPICECNVTEKYRAKSESEVLNSLKREITFRITPHYKGSGNPEVMLTVYPYENALTGSAVEWINVTSDKNYFEHKFTNQE